MVVYSSIYFETLSFVYTCTENGIGISTKSALKIISSTLNSLYARLQRLYSITSCNCHFGVCDRVYQPNQCQWAGYDYWPRLIHICDLIPYIKMTIAYGNVFDCHFGECDITLILMNTQHQETIWFTGSQKLKMWSRLCCIFLVFQILQLIKELCTLKCS